LRRGNRGGLSDWLRCNSFDDGCNRRGSFRCGDRGFDRGLDCGGRLLGTVFGRRCGRLHDNGARRRRNHDYGSCRSGACWRLGHDRTNRRLGRDGWRRGLRNDLWRRARLRNDLARFRTWRGGCRRRRGNNWSSRMRGVGHWLSGSLRGPGRRMPVAPGLEICERSIFGVMPCGARDEPAPAWPAERLPRSKCARTFSASSDSSELEWVFPAPRPSSAKMSRTCLLLTSISRARSLIRTLLIRLFSESVSNALSRS